MNGVVTGVADFVTDNVTDISPVRALVGLKILNCVAAAEARVNCPTLSPLQGMNLTSLGLRSHARYPICRRLRDATDEPGLRGTAVSNLSPLEGWL